MQVKRIAECSKGSILQYFRPSLSYQLLLWFDLSFFQRFYCKTCNVLLSRLVWLLHCLSRIRGFLSNVAEKNNSWYCVACCFWGFLHIFFLNNSIRNTVEPGPEVIKLFSCSTQLNTKFQLLIKNTKPTNKEVSCFKSLRCSISHANKC